VAIIPWNMEDDYLYKNTIECSVKNNEDTPTIFIVFLLPFPHQRLVLNTGRVSWAWIDNLLRSYAENEFFVPFIKTKERALPTE
jgi:hypothetical protein